MLSGLALDRQFTVFAHDDPTSELGAAWGVMERLRQLLGTTNLDAAGTAHVHVGIAVVAADTEQCWKL